MEEGGDGEKEFDPHKIKNWHRKFNLRAIVLLLLKVISLCFLHIHQYWTPWLVSFKQGVSSSWNPLKFFFSYWSQHYLWYYKVGILRSKFLCNVVNKKEKWSCIIQMWRIKFHSIVFSKSIILLTLNLCFYGKNISIFQSFLCVCKIYLKYEFKHPFDMYVQLHIPSQCLFLSLKFNSNMISKTHFICIYVCWDII